jgi:hypothetical protein
MPADRSASIVCIREINFMRLGIAKSVKALSAAAAAGAICSGAGISAAATLAPNLSFGGGDGWRAPFEVLAGDTPITLAADPVTAEPRYKYLGNAVPVGTNPATALNGGNLERGMAYNPITGHLILVSRNDASAGMIRILDGTTGVDVGELNKGTGVLSGGNFLVNMVGVAEDGAIYVGNLSTNTSATPTPSPFNVYRWADEAATPTLAFSGAPGDLLPGSRIGDSFDVIGSGAATRLVAGYGSPGNNGVALMTTSDGLNFTASNIATTTTGTQKVLPTGELRLGLTFIDNDTIMGKSTINEASLIDIGTGTGVVTNQITTDGVVLRPMDYAMVDGRPIAVMLEASVGTADPSRARIFVYDMSDLSLPLVDRKIAEASALPSAQVANGNNVGSVKFGAINGNVATIYAMSTNNGIQSFTLTLDPVVTPVDDADFNGNGIVDGADFLIWQRGFGLSAQTDKSTGDADGDGNVNDADLAVWKNQFGTTTAAATVGAVPEPGTLALASLALLGGVGWRRR